MEDKSQNGEECRSEERDEVGYLERRGNTGRLRTELTSVLKRGSELRPMPETGHAPEES